jgi:hypothetical protein
VPAGVLTLHNRASRRLPAVVVARTRQATRSPRARRRAVRSRARSPGGPRKPDDEPLVRRRGGRRW